MELEISSGASPSKLSYIFYNDRGLRAGWRLLIYIGMIFILVWGAGLQANPLVRSLGLELQKANRSAGHLPSELSKHHLSLIVGIFWKSPQALSYIRQFADTRVDTCCAAKPAVIRNDLKLNDVIVVAEVCNSNAAKHNWN